MNIFGYAFFAIGVFLMVFSCFVLKKQEKNYKNKIKKIEKNHKEQIREFSLETSYLYEKISDLNKIIKNLKEALEKERRNSCIDSLTGIYNRKYLDENAEQIVDLSERFGQSIQFLLLDLDNFKKINDTLGHAVGDDILRKVADKIRSVARHTDTYVRLGGDEFFLILPGTDSNGAKLLSRRLEREISKIPKELGITCSGFGASIGAINHKTGDSFEKSMKNADGMMYRVKERRKKR